MEASQTSIRRHCTCPKILILPKINFNNSKFRGNLKSIGVKKWDQSEDTKECIQKLISNFKESKCRKHKPYQMIY
jgi:hypothetical protein